MQLRHPAGPAEPIACGLAELCRATGLSERSVRYAVAKLAKEKLIEYRRGRLRTKSVFRMLSMPAVGGAEPPAPKAPTPEEQLLSQIEQFVSILTPETPLKEMVHKLRQVAGDRHPIARVAEFLKQHAATHPGYTANMADHLVEDLREYLNKLPESRK